LSALSVWCVCRIGHGVVMCRVSAAWCCTGMHAVLRAWVLQVLLWLGRVASCSVAHDFVWSRRVKRGCLGRRAARSGDACSCVPLSPSLWPGVRRRTPRPGYVGPGLLRLGIVGSSQVRYGRVHLCGVLFCKLWPRCGLVRGCVASGVLCHRRVRHAVVVCLVPASSSAR